MIRSSSIAIVTALGLGALATPLVTGMWRGGHSVWTEVQWPFPIDEWGTGKAFRCKAADCGTELNVYIRPKIGFCDCLTGVSDDAELERLSDFGLIGGPVARLGEGRAVRVAWMKGRSRAYQISGGRSALSIAFNSECDAIVASALFDGERAAVAEPQVIELLNGPTVVQWAKLALGQ
jgi:hypothetical protein